MHLSGVPPARARARPLCAPSRAPSSLAAYADDRRVLGDVSAGEETRAADVPGAGAADVPGADAFAAHLASLTDPGELDKLTALLPPRLRDALRDHPRRLALLEVVLDLGRAPIARFADGDETITTDALTYDDIDAALAGVGDVGGDNRAGVNGTLHRVSVIRNRAGAVVGITARVGRAIEGSADLVLDLLRGGSSVLLLGRPGVGKTTAIREIARVLSSAVERNGMARRVVIVDTSNEIGGDGDIPHPGIGAARRMQVPSPDSQHHVLIEAVQNHTPEVVIVDEIGTELEAQAARTISQRGVQMIATAHGHTLENLLKNPTLNDLVGGVASVTLGDDEARRRRVQKSVLEREGPPTFGAAVEMLEIGRWRVHLDVGVAVDTLLAGYEPHVEIRELDERTGEVVAVPWLGDGGSSGVSDGARRGAVAGPFGFGAGGGAQGAAPAAPAFPSYDRILGGWGDTGAGPPPGASSGIVRSSARKKAVTAKGPETSSGLAAREVSEAAARRDGSDASGSDDFVQTVGLFRVYPHELDCDVVEEVIESLGLSERCVLTSVLEEASAVLAVKARVKGATWLRHAARARGMPIYALKAEGIRSWRAPSRPCSGSTRESRRTLPTRVRGLARGWGVPRTIPIPIIPRTAKKRSGKTMARRERERVETRVSSAPRRSRRRTRVSLFLVKHPLETRETRPECLSERGGDGRAGGGAHGGGTAGDPAPGAGGAAAARRAAFGDAEGAHRAGVPPRGGGVRRGGRQAHTHPAHVRQVGERSRNTRRVLRYKRATRRRVLEVRRESVLCVERKVCVTPS